MKVRPIAFVLPQFHPIPENDLWWGRGFTEWINVTKSTPLFKDHYQPQLPSDLGFYDLRLPEARKAQAEIAKEYGIYGFCYYHYWFNGKRLLKQPIDEILMLGTPEMPFMLCWANENWTRRWDGKNQEVLIKQEYSLEDDKEHMRWLCKNVFRDKRYITVNDCPVFAIYDHRLCPNLIETAEIWRKIAVEEFGFKNLYLCLIESFNVKVNPKEMGFDASIEFSPHKVLKHFINPTWREKTLRSLGLIKQKSVRFTDFIKGAEECMARTENSFKLFRSVTPSWDNTARRRSNATVALGSSPDFYYKWLKHTVQDFQPYSEDENFIFINAMNEWAEGNHLEPCIKYGRAYLEATKRALDNGDNF